MLFRSLGEVGIPAGADGDLTEYIPSIKGLVKNAIEGLAYDKIQVTIFKDMPPLK